MCSCPVALLTTHTLSTSQQSATLQHCCTFQLQAWTPDPRPRHIQEWYALQAMKASNCLKQHCTAWACFFPRGLAACAMCAWQLQCVAGQAIRWTCPRGAQRLSKLRTCSCVWALTLPAAAGGVWSKHCGTLTRCHRELQALTVTQLCRCPCAQLHKAGRCAMTAAQPGGSHGHAACFGLPVRSSAQLAARQLSCVDKSCSRGLDSQTVNGEAAAWRMPRMGRSLLNQ